MKIREEYPDKIMNTFSVMPSPKVISSIFYFSRELVSRSLTL